MSDAASEVLAELGMSEHDFLASNTRLEPERVSPPGIVSTTAFFLPTADGADVSELQFSLSLHAAPAGFVARAQHVAHLAEQRGEHRAGVHERWGAERVALTVDEAVEHLTTLATDLAALLGTLKADGYWPGTGGWR